MKNFFKGINDFSKMTVFPCTVRTLVMSVVFLCFLSWFLIDVSDELLKIDLYQRQIKIQEEIINLQDHQLKLQKLQLKNYKEYQQAVEKIIKNQ